MKRSLFALFATAIALASFSPAFIPTKADAQGMPIDSLMGRLTPQFANPFILADLAKLIPNYANQRVWGLAVGDFSNDSLPDLGISVYELGGAKNRVTVYLFQNIGGNHFKKVLERQIAYVASPIEVGLLAEGSVLTIIQKTADAHWYQEGFSIEDGDLVLVDHYETEKQDIPGKKVRSIGHETYRNYETLQSRETYYSGSGESMLNMKYITFPSYRRLKNVYPGYGFGASDTSTAFVLEGLGLRKNSSDLSIRNAVTSYDEDYLYFSISVNDNNIVGNQAKDEANDRVSLWFDTRKAIDRRVKSKVDGFPTFRNTPDSSLYNLTFVLPAAPGHLTRLLYSSQAPLSPDQQEAQKGIKAMMTLDTLQGGRVSGYTLRARIPFGFFGYESNPVNIYERGGPRGESSMDSSSQSNGLDRSELEDAPSMGFTAIVYDIDDPSRPLEFKTQATSNFKINDPSSLGTLILEPSTKFYGEVWPTYTNVVRTGLGRAGF
jgi:hypothetical protein